VVAAIASLVTLGCQRAPRVERDTRPISLPIQVLSDTGERGRLPMPPPEVARAWLQGVTRRAPAAARPTAPSGALEVPPPAAEPAVPEPQPESAPSLAVDEDLKPPIPRGVAPLKLSRSRASPTWADLDVRVDESGNVSDALWAEGNADSAEVAAAIECALAMRFHPALQHGRPVAVWCRQRFRFSPGGATPEPPASAHP
jgi:hypothetical protein